MASRPERPRRLRRALRALALLFGVYLAAGFLTARLSPQPRLGVEGSDFTRLGVTESTSDPSVGHVVRGALSVHSGRSHDAEGTLAEVGGAARKTGLDFVFLGDHPEVWTEAADAFEPRRVEGVLIVPGVEMVVADRGRVLAVGLDTVPRRWESSLEELLARVDSTEGFVSVVHPRSPRNRERWQDQDARGVHAWEAFDVSEMARARLNEVWAPYHLVSLFAGLPIGRTDEALVGLWRERSATPAILAYDTIHGSARVTLTGGLNHHPKARVPGGLFPPYTPFLRTVVNHLRLAEPLSDDPHAARAQLTHALRSGAVHVSLGHPDRVAGFRFWAEALDGTAAAAGEEVQVEAPSRVALRVRIPDAAPGRVYVRLIRDGRTALWAEGRAGETLMFGGADGVHRIEIHHAGMRVPLLGRLNLRPWILSNPIAIRRASPDSTRMRTSR